MVTPCEANQECNMNHCARVFRCLFAVVVSASTALVCGDQESTRSAPKRDPAAKKTPDNPSIKNHLRLKHDKKGEPSALQTSIARYVPASGNGGVTVDLVSVVHIADEGYYQYLDRHFEQYDVLLYELVAPPGERVPRRDADADNPLRLVQKISQSVLALKHQVDHIDYTKENFVHADMSPEEMRKAIEKRGDDGLTLILSITADLLRQQNLKQRELKKHPEKLREPEEIDPFEMLLDEHGSTKFKRMIAKEFANLEEAGSGMGATIDRILIEDRNRAALRVFQKELAKGKKKIGIFYGAAHMPDFERRLVHNFGLKRQDVQWVTAWDLTMRRKAPVEGILSTLLEELLRESLRE